MSIGFPLSWPPHRALDRKSELFIWEGAPFIPAQPTRHLDLPALPGFRAEKGAFSCALSNFWAIDPSALSICQSQTLARVRFWSGLRLQAFVALTGIFSWASFPPLRL
jgi:hypothetical protein